MGTVLGNADWFLHCCGLQQRGREFCRNGQVEELASFGLAVEPAVENDGSPLMVDTYTKAILTLIALVMVIQLLKSELHRSAGSQLRHPCGSASEPCYVKFSVLDKPCGEAVTRPCFVILVPGGTGTTPERP